MIPPKKSRHTDVINPITASHPPLHDITRFVDVFRRLDAFEAQQRSIRGHGAFDPSRDPLPDPAVVRVLRWLNGLR